MKKKLLDYLVFWNRWPFMFYILHGVVLFVAAITVFVVSAVLKGNLLDAMDSLNGERMLPAFALVFAHGFIIVIASAFLITKPNDYYEEYWEILETRDGQLFFLDEPLPHKGKRHLLKKPSGSYFDERTSMTFNLPFNFRKENFCAEAVLSLELVIEGKLDVVALFNLLSKTEIEPKPDLNHYVSYHFYKFNERSLSAIGEILTSYVKEELSLNKAKMQIVELLHFPKEAFIKVQMIQIEVTKLKVSVFSKI